ncbi:hypothetical protein C2G38_2211583 [Gigaspora rosea]|uniref:Uncharacterized protein n=1 Tax=Gigaspora rosea TaxID=44941 RepID=A0A397UDX4_9GLOM|nr:hypothetical protein C2G38_2211583 [Gigaspora rosea]
MKFFPDDVPYISYHCTHKERTSQCFLPNISYAFVEIPKFNKHKEQLKTTEDYWVHFLKEASNETEPPKEAPNDNYLIRTAKIDRSKEIVLKLSELGLPLDIIVNATGLLSLEITKLINQ